MTFGSICSGIEAASVAWHPLGWQTAWVSEIDTFCCSLLQHHYPDTKNYGDFTQIPASAPRIDVLVGGTPCQSFSVAGLRGGLVDDRGNLAIEFCRLVDRLRPRWFVWENVPGVLSSNGGRDFGSILGAMGELGYGTAYRVLDAQFFGVPQRRRRVFVVGYLGDWRRAAAVLFERHSLSGHPPPSREKGERLTRNAARSVAISGRDGTPQAELGDEVANVILTPNGGRGGVGAVLESEVTHEPTPNEIHCFDARQNAVISYGDKTGPLDQNAFTHAILQPVAYRVHGENSTAMTGDGDAHVADSVDITRALDSSGGYATNQGGNVILQPLAIQEDNQNGVCLRDNAVEDGIGTLKARKEGGGFEGSVMTPTAAVRRLTPRECELLQGFSPGYTLIQVRGKLSADGPRYKALGNSMAVPVMRWIGERIQKVDKI